MYIFGTFIAPSPHWSPVPIVHMHYLKTQLLRNQKTAKKLAVLSGIPPQQISQQKKEVNSRFFFIKRTQSIRLHVLSMS